jgi:hypothetical protein
MALFSTLTENHNEKMVIRAFSDVDTFKIRFCTGLARNLSTSPAK